MRVLILFIIGIIAGIVTGCSGCSALPTPATLRLASLNMAAGAGGSFATDAARASQRTLIAELAPDVMSLQEVPDDAASILPPGALFRAGDVAVWARDGLALDRAQDVPLEYGAWVDGVFISDAWPRHAACARVSGPGISITLSAVHLTAGVRDEGGRDRDPAPVRAVEMDEATVLDPDVVAGDFNALSREIGETLGPLGYSAATRGAVDAVWLKSGERGVMEPAGGASDHPTVATVTIRRSR
jgi:hypothetical protein